MSTKEEANALMQWASETLLLNIEDIKQVSRRQIYSSKGPLNARSSAKPHHVEASTVFHVSDFAKSPQCNIHPGLSSIKMTEELISTTCVLVD